MSWRYINPGLVSLFNSDGTAIQYTGYEYSNTGYAFAITTNAPGFTLLGLKQGDDFWCRLDVYYPARSSTGTSFYLPIPGTNQRQVQIYCSADKRIQFRDTTGIYTDYIAFTDVGFKENAVNSLCVHAIYDTSGTANFEFITPNGRKLSLVSDTLVYGDNYERIINICTNDSGLKFSNIIFASNEIGLHEQAIALPASVTETTMATMAGGMYIANSIGQTFLQTPDVSSLITAHGANSTVTGFEIIAQRAYRTGTGLTKITGLKKSGTTITDQSTMDVGTDGKHFIGIGGRLSGVTLGDLQNMQFGWKAAR